MASEFDNEMDFLLRQAARQNNVASDLTGETAHFDADDLSAFAENALPQQIRLNVISHLADCNSCRRILSNLILLNEDAQTDAVAQSTEKAVVAKPSWLDSFKKLFAFPVFGYATATLAVLLVSVFALIALRGTQPNGAVSVARVEPEQIDDVQEAKKRAAVHAPAAVKDQEEEPKAEEQPSAELLNSNTEPLAESSTPMPAENEAENLPPSVLATKRINQNSVAANVPARRETSLANLSNLNSTSNASAPQLQPASPSAVGGAVAKPGTPSSEIASSEAAPKPIERAKTQLSRAKESTESATDDKSESVADASPERAAKPVASSSVANELKSKKVVVETRTIGGKTFQKVGAVWQDAAYNSQNVTNVVRGSDDFKKLDSALRSIAQTLGGEIIVIWEGKAYRIR